MSMDYYVLCDIPLSSIQVWQNSIMELGFDMTINQDQAIDLLKGFLPTTWRGQPAGFEFSTIPVRDLFETYDDIDFGGTWPFAYVMYASSLPSCGCALIAAAAIVRKTGGRVFDPQDELIMEPDEAARYAARVERDILQLQSRNY